MKYLQFFRIFLISGLKVYYYSETDKIVKKSKFIKIY